MVFIVKFVIINVSKIIFVLLIVILYYLFSFFLEIQ